MQEEPPRSWHQHLEYLEHQTGKTLHSLMLPVHFVQHSVCYQTLKETMIFQIKNIVPKNGMNKTLMNSDELFSWCVLSND